MMQNHFADGRAEECGIEDFADSLAELQGLRSLRTLIEEAKTEEIEIDELVADRPRKHSGAKSIFATAHKKDAKDGAGAN
jgi:hypothetical protein